MADVLSVRQKKRMHLPPDNNSYKIECLPQALYIQLWGQLSRLSDEDALLADLESYCKEGISNWILDLAEVSFIDSKGLGLLLTLLAKARQCGGDLILLQLGEQVEKLLVITKLRAIFNIKRDVAGALEEFSVQ